MPHGVDIPPEVRRIIYNQHVIYKKTAENIFSELFLGDDTLISLRRIINVCKFFDSDSLFVEVNSYVAGNRKRKGSAGRKLKLDKEAQNYLQLLNKKNPSMRMISLAALLKEQYFADPSHAICSKSVNTYLHRFNLSNKKAKREHREQDPKLQLEYLDEIGDKNPADIVDIDGTIQRPKISMLLMLGLPLVARLLYNKLL